jgi:hypothetical protein
MLTQTPLPWRLRASNDPASDDHVAEGYAAVRISDDPPDASAPFSTPTRTCRVVDRPARADFEHHLVRKICNGEPWQPAFRIEGAPVAWTIVAAILAFFTLLPLAAMALAWGGFAWRCRHPYPAPHPLPVVAVALSTTMWTW